MNVTEDKRYTRDTHIRVDREFDEKLKKLRELTGIKTNSKAIRYAVDYTVFTIMDRLEQNEDDSEKKRQQSETLLEPGTPRDVSERAKTLQDAEELRRACVEIQLLAENGEKYHYLSEEQVAILMTYQREMARMMKELLKR